MAAFILMTSYILSTCVLWHGVPGDACYVDPADAGKNFTMALTLTQAPIVVLGQFSSFPANSDSEGRDLNFQVYCVLKAGGQGMPRLLSVAVSSCHNTFMKPAEIYVLALNQPRSKWEFMSYAPAAMTTGAFLATDDVIEEVYELEGLDGVFIRPVGQRVGPEEECGGPTPGGVEEEGKDRPTAESLTEGIGSIPGEAVDGECPAWVTLERQRCVQPGAVTGGASGSNMSPLVYFLLGAVWFWV